MRKGFVVKVEVNRKDKSQRYNEGISMFSTLCLRTERERGEDSEMFPEVYAWDLSVCEIRLW